MPSLRPGLLALLTTVPSTAAPVLAQLGSTLWNVSDDAQLAAAIAQSAPGDTILLAPGGYVPPVVLDGKGVTLVGAGSSNGDGRTTRLLGSLEIRNLPAGQQVLLQSLDLLDPFFGGLTRNLEGNDGCVWFSDVYARGGPETPGPDDPTRFRVADCACVVFERCVVQGTIAFEPGAGFSTVPPGAGLEVHGSHVWCYDTLLLGGGGGAPLSGFQAFDGSDAVQTSGQAQLALSRSELRGADGSTGPCGGADGGDAIDVASGTLSLYRRDSALVAGLASAATPPCVVAGVDGSTLAGDPSAIDDVVWPGPGPLLTAPSPIGEGLAVQIQVSSGPSQPVLLLASTVTTPGVPPLGLHLAVPLVVVPLGTTAADGTLGLVTGGFELPPQLDVQRVLLQPVAIETATLEVGLGNPVPVTVLAS